MPPTIPPGTSGAYLADSQTQQFAPTCVYCSGKHFSASCETVTELNARRTILARDKRCFMCLRKGHQQDQCQKTCRRCEKRHHQSICPRNANSSNNNNNNAQNTERPLNSDRSTQERPRDQTINERENTGITTATTTNRESSKANCRVLLQTAKAVVTNEDGTRSTVVRLLFDSGSQRSYITENTSNTSSEITSN